MAVGQSILNRKKIYLDSKYWVYLRDAAMGRSKLTSHDELLGKLRNAVERRKIVCPISDVTYSELMQQTDPESKRATARLIDELSLGVALLAEESRIATELAHLLYELGMNADVHQKDEIVFVRVGYVLGQGHPASPQLDEKTNQLFQKATIDYFWSLSTEDIAMGTQQLPSPSQKFEETAQKLNANARANAHEVKNFKQLTSVEIAGILSVFKEHIAEISTNMFFKAHRPQRIDPGEFDTWMDKIYSMLVNAFHLKPKKMAQQCPTVYAHALCHAAARWDKRRNLDGHDLLDFHHASAAVGYCDAFFTEKSLCALLTAGHVALDKTFDCRILAKEEEAIAYLEEQS